MYYAAVPSGSAPLVLRKPNHEDTQTEEPQIDEPSDVVLAPTEGDLVLFPPWVEHGVPLAEEQQQQHTDSVNLPRVSFAFNVTGALALGNDPWNVTRLS